MTKKRNGLLEIYRFLLAFMPLYYHNFFYLKRNYEIFEVPELAVDFFFMISGFFLLSSMRKLKEEKTLIGTWKIMSGRIKPMVFTMGFIITFNLICVILFIRDDYFHTLFRLFMYWWFVLYLVVAIGILYLVYRFVKSEKYFAIFLAALSVTMAIIHYLAVDRGMFFSDIVFFTRTLGCTSVGILLSYIPILKYKKFNIGIPAVIILFPTILYLYYNDKNFLMCLVIIALFGALIYFSSSIPVSGRVFDILGRLSVRIYLYLSLCRMFRMLGVDDNRILFFINIGAAITDLTVTYLVKRNIKCRINKKAT